MQRLKKIVHRRRTSCNSEDVVTLSVPKNELQALATDVGVAPQKTGVLLKYTNVVKRWKHRTFVLENGLLVYSTPMDADADEVDAETAADGERKKKKKLKKRRLRHTSSKDEKERDVRGTINLQFAVVSPDDSDATRFAIDIGNDVFHVKAENEAERNEWVAALNGSNEYFKGLIQKAVARAKERKGTEEQTPGADRTSAPANAAQDSQPGLDAKESIVTTDKSYDSEESILEDDGLKEAEASRTALMSELRRVLAQWRSKWVTNGELPRNTTDFVRALSDAFEDENGGEVTTSETAKGLLDLVSWCLHTLETNDELFNRRLKADLTRMMGSGLAVFPSSPSRPKSDPALSLGYDEDDDDAEFFDALSRATSRRSVADFVLHDPNEVILPISEGELANVRRVSTVRISRGYSGMRTSLPKLDAGREKLNIFSILKDSVGKDLAKISMPVSLNEPLSFLQRLAEDIEYSELLDQAAEEEDPERRLMYVAACIISHYSSTQGRLGKPFNPLLGETASLVMPHKGKGLRFIAEQVCHHPPISACYAEGTGASWKYYNSVDIKNKFWGKSLEVFPTGLHHVEIPQWGDHYVFEQVTACVHNIVVGRMWLDNYGQMEIVNRTNGGKCVLDFSKTGWMSDAKSFAAVKGKIYDSKGKEKIKISGNWTQALYEDLPKGKRRLIWAAEERPVDGASQTYDMTKWAISLNAPVSNAERDFVAPSDSRLRPDQRALENGDLELASTCKVVLEEGQRSRRRAREEAGETWEPIWFEKVTDEVTGLMDYRFKGDFFEKQAVSDWSQCPDLFSCALPKPGGQTQAGGIGENKV